MMVTEVTTVAEVRPAVRELILRMLKQSKGMTAQELACVLAISPVAVRKHLDALQQEGLVTVALRRQRMGRPSYSYVLTPNAARVFPEDYRNLLLDLLQDLATPEGEHKIKGVLEKRAAQQQQSYEVRLRALATDDDRLQELARLRNEDGYMTDLEEQEAAYILRQYNCPIEEVSRRFRQACGCEIDLLRRLLGTRAIERLETVLNGDASCSYRIPKSEAAE